MIADVLPREKWYDFETFYSCAIKPETFFDPYTGQYPANTMSVYWAIDGFASLYEAEQNKTWLDAAEACADYSLFYQAVWAPHYIISAYPFGGFSSQNSDGEWLDHAVTGLRRPGKGWAFVTTAGSDRTRCGRPESLVCIGQYAAIGKE